MFLHDERQEWEAAYKRYFDKDFNFVVLLWSLRTGISKRTE
jgi:hypothetical protein